MTEPEDSVPIRPAWVALAAVFFVLGLIFFPTPLPLGVPFWTLSLLTLAPMSPWARRKLRNLLVRYPWMQKRLTSYAHRLPPMMRRTLEQANPPHPKPLDRKFVRNAAGTLPTQDPQES